MGQDLDDFFIANLASFLDVDDRWVSHVLDRGFGCGCTWGGDGFNWCETYQLMNQMANAEKALERTRVKLREHLEATNQVPWARLTEPIGSVHDAVTVNRVARAMKHWGVANGFVRNSDPIETWRGYAQAALAELNRVHVEAKG